MFQGQPLLLQKKILHIAIPQFAELMEDIQNFTNWNFKINHSEEPGSELQSTYGFNMAIINFPIVFEIVALCDTMCTNSFNFQLFFAVGIDQNNCNQIIGFGLIKSKTIDDIKGFLQFIKDISIHPIRLFVTDRAPSQFNAINQVFPESSIYSV